MPTCACYSELRHEYQPLLCSQPQEAIVRDDDEVSTCSSSMSGYDCAAPAPNSQFLSCALPGAKAKPACSKPYSDVQLSNSAGSEFASETLLVALLRAAWSQTSGCRLPSAVPLASGMCACT